MKSSKLWYFRSKCLPSLPEKLLKTMNQLRKKLLIHQLVIQLIVSTTISTPNISPVFFWDNAFSMYGPHNWTFKVCCYVRLSVFKYFLLFTILDVLLSNHKSNQISKESGFKWVKSYVHIFCHLQLKSTLLAQTSMWTELESKNLALKGC